MTEANQEEVIQADREEGAALVEWHNKAASDWRPNLQFFASDMPDGIRRGMWDNHEIVQAFARHRRLHTPEVGERDIRAAFERARKEPYIKRLEHCPDSFERTDNGQGYVSPHIEADYRQFASGFRAALAALSRIKETGNG